MGIPAEFLIQYSVFGGLFLAGTLAYLLVSAKLKDPRAIYESTRT
jgi:hypothetical protein